MDTKIEKAIKYAKQIFADDCSGHDYYHTMRVHRLAMRIAEQENADMMNTDTARKIAEYRQVVMKEYLAEFMAEWEGER